MTSSTSCKIRRRPTPRLRDTMRVANLPSTEAMVFLCLFLEKIVPNSRRCASSYPANRRITCETAQSGLSATLLLPKAFGSPRSCRHGSPTTGPVSLNQVATYPRSVNTRANLRFHVSSSPLVPALPRERAPQPISLSKGPTPRHNEAVPVGRT